MDETKDYDISSSHRKPEPHLPWLSHMLWWLLDFSVSESGLTLLDYVHFRQHLVFVSQRWSAFASAVFLYLCSWACTHEQSVTGDFSMFLTPSLYKSGIITESSSVDSCGATHSSCRKTIYFINIRIFFLFQKQINTRTSVLVLNQILALVLSQILDSHF